MFLSSVHSVKCVFKAFHSVIELKSLLLAGGRKMKGLACAKCSFL